jgi:hypothetical protein
MSRRTSNKKQRFWQRLTHSPWTIAVVAPLLTAGAIGLYHVTASHVTGALGAPVSAYDSYDTSRTYLWSMSYMHVLHPSALPVDVKNCATMRKWLLAAGAADTSESHIRLHLVGTGSDTVTISGVHAQVLARIPVAPTTLVDCPSAGSVATPNVALDLRQDTPIALEVRPSASDSIRTGDASDLAGHLGAPYFGAHAITLKKGEPFDLAITGFISGKTSVRWRLIVDVEINGRRYSIPASGPAFITAPLICGRPYQQYWDWRWDLSPQRLVQQSSGDRSTCSANRLPY